MQRIPGNDQIAVAEQEIWQKKLVPRLQPEQVKIMHSILAAYKKTKIDRARKEKVLDEVFL
jgi:hypothetical protein